MSAWLAYSLVGAFALFQALPLILAYRVKARAWVFTQAGFGLAMFALASLQYDGRSRWLLFITTAATMIVTSALSALIALIAYHWRARRPANSEVI